MTATTTRKALPFLLTLALMGAAAPMRPHTIVVTTSAELEAAMTPANAGKRILVRAGEYVVANPLTVPDDATVAGEGRMAFDEAGLPTGFDPSSRTHLVAASTLVGDILTLGDGVTVRDLSIEDALGRNAGNPVVVSSRAPADFVSAEVVECEIVNPNPPLIIPAGPTGRGLVAITRNPNLGADPPPHDGAVLSVEMRRSIVRSPGGGYGIFGINFASHAEIRLVLHRSVIGGGLNVSGGVSRPDAVTESSVCIQSRRNLYRADLAVDGASGWALIGGTTAPIPGLASAASTYNSLRLDSRNDAIEGFPIGIQATGGLRATPIPEPSHFNSVVLDVHELGIQTTDDPASADLVLFGAKSFVDGMSAGDNNTARVLLRQSTGSGARANAYGDSLLGLGTGNQLEIVGTEKVFKRSNDKFDPIPPTEFFTE